MKQYVGDSYIIMVSSNADCELEIPFTELTIAYADPIKDSVTPQMEYTEQIVFDEADLIHFIDRLIKIKEQMEKVRKDNGLMRIQDKLKQEKGKLEKLLQVKKPTAEA